MPRLDFYVNYELQATVTLEEPELLIGRSPGCALRIPDETVSRVHAVISSSDDGHQIANRSANGTKVNGVRIETVTPLRPGDIIWISQNVLIYQADDVPPADNATTILPR